MVKYFFLAVLGVVLDLADVFYLGVVLESSYIQVHR
jgi:hypothetical protein